MQFNTVGFFVLMIALLSVSACQVTPQAYRPVDPAPGSLLADRAGGTVFLDEEEAPNPVGVEGITTRAERYIPRHFSDLDGSCEGFAARQPAMTVDTSQGLSAAQVALSGEAEILLIEGPKGTTCLSGEEAARVDIQDWPAGRYRFYAGTKDRYARFTYDFVFEDLNAPMTLPWMTDDSLLHLEGLGRLDEPLHHSMALEQSWASAAAAVRPTSECLSEGFETDYLPRARLTVDEDATIGIAALAPAPMELLLVGPVSDDGRTLPVSCVSARADDLEVEPGEYFLFFALQDGPIPPSVNLLVHDESAEFERTFLATEPSAGLDLDARAIVQNYPFLSPNQLWYTDRLRAEIFTQAPSELFVALGDDAEEARIFIATDRQSGHRYRGVDEGQFPRAGELGLLVDMADDRGHFLSADGLIFSVPTRLLVPAEEVDALTLPDTPRTEPLELEEALSLVSRDDRKVVNQFQAAHEEYDQCVDAVFAEIEDELKAFDDDPDATQAQIDELVDQTEQQARQECDFEALTEVDDEIRHQLQEARTERRHAVLQTHGERLRSLFE